MTRMELQRYYKLFINLYWGKNNYNWKYFRASDRELMAYVKWAPVEISRVIRNLPQSCDNQDTKYDALYEFETVYMTQLGDWVEVFQITHRQNTINPFEILMDLCQNFLDNVYDSMFFLGINTGNGFTTVC